MIVPMKRLPIGSLFHINDGQGDFPVPQRLPKGRPPPRWTGDGKTVLHLLIVENIQQMPIDFVYSI